MEGRGDVASPRLGVCNHTQSIISGTGKATDFKFGRCIHRIHPNKSPLKFWRKGSLGVSEILSQAHQTPHTASFSVPYTTVILSVILVYTYLLVLDARGSWNISKNSRNLWNFQTWKFHPTSLLDDDGLNSWSFHAPISDQHLSSLFLNEFVVGASITCCGNEFQLLQTRTLKQGLEKPLFCVPTDELLQAKDDLLSEACTPSLSKQALIFTVITYL